MNQFAAIQNEQGLVSLLPPNHQRIVDRKTATSEKNAAVLVLIVVVDGAPSLVFTQRSSHLSQHAAQISFPGGHYEEHHDDSLVDTAIREAKEELYNDDRGTIIDSKIDWSDLAVLGCATPVPSIRGVPVTPVIAGLLDASLSTPISTTWPGNPAEVDFVFTVSVSDLIRNESTKALKATKYNPLIPNAPIFRTPQGLTIYGLTAHVLKPLLDKLFRPVLGVSLGNG